MIDLPPELLREILMYCDSDILSLRLICKSWDNIITREIHRHARNSKLRGVCLGQHYNIPIWPSPFHHYYYRVGMESDKLADSLVRFSLLPV